MGSSSTEEGGGIKLQKQLGVLNGVSIIVGIIVGAGIFISPKGVLLESGSLGLSLIIWALCGVLCMIGALCYAELGTSIPKSGGDYAYIQEAFGPLFAFLYLWVALLIIMPTGNAIAALTFSNYVLTPFFPNCSVPEDAVRLIAALVVCLLTFINCYNVQWANKVQIIFTMAKMVPLGIIICVGGYRIITGKLENFEDSFKGTIKEPSRIALSFYSGLFSFSGWNYLNFVTEEMKNPFKNLPRAIYISIPLITVIYLLANVAYFTVLTPNEILCTNAVAMSFGEKSLWTSLAWVMPLSVALSTFGGLNGGIFASSRLFFVGARGGHLPSSLAMININKFTPAPSLMFLAAMTLIYLTTTQVYVLINYTSFIESLFITVSVAGLLKLRYTHPNMSRPIKVNLILPISFLIICTFLVVCPFFASPFESGMGLAITLTGVPVYYLAIHWNNKPKLYKKALKNFTYFVQKVLLSIPEEEEEPLASESL